MIGLITKENILRKQFIKYFTNKEWSGSMEKKRVIIDTDPGHDDTLAIMLALANEELDIKGITTVAGNTDIEHNTKNAVRVLEYFGNDIKVYKGAGKPLFNPFIGAADVHGETGLDGTSLPDAIRKEEEIPAVEFMEQTLKQEKITIIAIGPLTNVATLLLTAPELKSQIEEICIMGGAALGGNVTSAAEFNIWQDPEAAHIVFSAGVPLTMCGLDVTHRSGLTEKELEEIKSIGGKVGTLAGEIIDFYGKSAEHNDNGTMSFVIHDAVAVAKMLRPELFTIKPYHVDIDLDGVYTRGCTVTDMIEVTGKEKNVQVVLDVKRDEFARFLIESYKKLETMCK